MSEVEPSCANCEYFDGGGMNAVKRAVESGVVIKGDCHNSRSPRFTTNSDDICDRWTPSS